MIPLTYTSIFFKFICFFELKKKKVFLLFTLNYDWIMNSGPDIFMSECESCSVVSDSLQPHGLYSWWNSPGQNTGVGSLPLLQGIFPTQGLNPGLPHCRRILYQLSHKGSPRMLEWVAYPFSSRSPRPRNQTRVSCIAWGFFTREAHFSVWWSLILLV